MTKLAPSKPPTPRKRTGRPPRTAYAPEDMRHIPLDLSHADVERLDAEAARLGISRAELCRRRLRAPFPFDGVLALGG